MKNLILKTNNDWTGLITRLTIGLIIFPHGAQMMLGWFGGYGFSGSMAYFTTKAGHNFSWLIAFLVIIIEFLGTISLMAGLASRIWSIAMIVIFIGMILTTHFNNGFFMNWSGNQKGEGFEYHLLVIGLSLATLINGSGKYSLDQLLTKENQIQK